MRRFLPFAALIGVALVLGCQDVGTGPDGLVPQFGKPDANGNHDHGGDDGGDGDNPGSPFYEYTFAGDITTEPATPGAKGEGRLDVYLHSCCIDPNVVDLEELDLSRLLMDVPDAKMCFGGGPFPGLRGIHWLSTNNQVVNEVEARFLFDAKDKDDNPIRYRLTLDGNAVTTANAAAGDGIFPPEVGETMRVTFTTFSIGPQRNKEKNACSDADVITTTSVQITGTLVDPHPER